MVTDVPFGQLLYNTHKHPIKKKKNQRERNKRKQPGKKQLIYEKQVNHRLFEKLTLTYENQYLSTTKPIYPFKDTNYPRNSGYRCYTCF